MTEKKVAANRRNALRSTGPRTANGKRRSSRNALKHGLRSTVLLLEGESPAEYQSLLNGLRDDHQPQGALECECVENIAELTWRKRRLIAAESAKISEKATLAAADFLANRHAEAWDWSRAAIASGGLLKHIDNPIVVQEAKDMLVLFRGVVLADGFGQDSRLLKKLYGEDQDGETPFSLLVPYGFFAARVRSGEDDAELKKTMITLIDVEIERLTGLEEELNDIELVRMEYMSSAAIILDPGLSHHLMRYETHFRHEIDATIDRIERLQQERKRQPPAPRV